MRKLLVFATAAVFIFGSCSNEDELNPTGTNNESAIEFRTLIDKGGSSRAAITNAENMLSFTVTGKWDDEKTGTDSEVDDHNRYLFNAFGITRGEDGLWGYTPKRYLPVAGKVDFYAYSPAASKNISIGIKDYAYTVNAIKYTVPTIGKTEAQEDFLVARRTGIRNSGTGNTTVKLNFHHALSRVKFHGRKTKEDITYVISEIALVNLYPTGTLKLGGTFITEDGGLDYSAATTEKWVPVGATKEEYIVDMGKSPIMLPYDATDDDTKKKFYSLLGETNDILVLPQTTPLFKGDKTAGPAKDAAFAIRIKYQAYDKRGMYYAGGPKSTDYETVHFPVDGGTTDDDGIEFEMERQYNFYLTFGDEVGGPISFDTKVSEWTDGN